MAHESLVNNIPVAIYSLEMGGDELAKRLFARESGIDGITIRNGRLVGNQLDRLTAACGRVGQMPLFVRDRPDMSISQIRADARRMHAAHGVKLIVVDYIQLVSPDKSHDSREREVASISRGLKQMAKELSVPVIALSQTNKQGELRESAAIGQDSDVVLSIWDQEAEDRRNIRVDKNRHGARKVNIAVSFDGAHGVLEEIGGESK
jgi:replicative DNA helicase